MGECEDRDGIAIIGMACRFPGADTPTAFWNNLCQGVESITTFSNEELLAAGVEPTLLHDPNYVKAAPILHDVDKFDASFFEYSPKEAALMDPQHRIFLEVAWEAFEDAGYYPESYEGVIGVIAGAGGVVTSYLVAHQNHPALPGQTAGLEHIGNDKDFLSTRVSYKLNLTGPSLTVQTACSTSLVAVHLACQSLRSGECDMVLAGASTIRIPQIQGYLVEKGNINSPDGHCRAFDAAAQGTVFGSGVGAVLLKNVQDAMVDHDHIYAVIKSTAINNDGAMKVSYTAPSVTGQARAMVEALTLANVSPATLGYVECHGSGTIVGDPLEIQALTRAFRMQTTHTQFCAIGSVKTNIGHLEQTAGMTGLMKTALALQHKRLPPILHFVTPNPKLDFDNSPFYVNTALREWPEGDTPRRAAVNSLGVGGTNAFAVLEEAPKVPQIPSQDERPLHLLSLSAKSETGLLARVEQLHAFLNTNTHATLADICYTTNVSRSHFSYRFSVVTDSLKDLKLKLANFSEDISKDDRLSRRAEQKPIAFLFTGQGSQYPGMAAELYHTQSTFRETLDQCNDYLRPYLDMALLDVLFARDDDALLLHETAYTQPALFAVEYALAQLWMTWGVMPSAVMGHSIGELVAACVADVFDLEEALRLVAERGRLMQELPKQGTMAVVFAAEATVRNCIAPYQNCVSIAAVNSPKNTVISGEREAVTSILQRLKTQDIASKALTVSHAFHSPLMEPILDDFETTASHFECRAPQITLISNLTGKPLDKAPAPQYWCDHVRQTVRFADGIQTLHELGYELFMEIGPSHALLTMGQQCLPKAQAVWLSCLRQHQSDWQTTLSSLQKLYLEGCSIDWQVFDRGYARHRVPLPTYPFQRKRYWLDVSPPHGKGLQPQAETSPPQPSLKSLRPAAKQTFTDWLYYMRWDERPPSSLHHVSAAEGSASWLILADHGGVGEALAELLGQRGGQCHLAYAAADFASSGCKRWSINPACREDFHQLVQEVRAAQQHRFQGAIYLWCLDMPSMQDMALDQLEVAEAVGIGSALFLTQALAQSRSLGTFSPRLWFVTRNAQKLGTASAPTQAVQAPLWGLGRVVSLEYPQMWGGLIDLPPAEPVPVHKDATALLAEILRSDREDQVVLRDGTRFVPRFVRLPSESPGQDAMLFRHDATYMITGGLGILGLKAAQWLVQQKGVRYLVLIGRRDAQGSTRDAVKGLEALGARVHIMQADISVEADVQRVIEAIQQQLPALKGVIHCAGVLDDGVLSQMDWQKFTRATAPKIKGSWLLHSYTQHMQLDFFVLFSSLVSLTGAAGQANYTAGNAFLDALVAYRHALGLPALAIQWGPWDDGGMATASGSRGETIWRARGMKYIPAEDGMHVFDYLLHRRVDHAAVTITDWSVYVEQFPECPPVYAELAREVGPQSEKKRANDGQDVQTRLRLAPKPELRAILVDIIRQQVMDELGLQETFDTRQPLNELGLDSLMSVNLVNRLETALGISIPVVQLIQGPNLDQFIDDLFPDLERLLGATHTTETDAPTNSATSPSTTTSPERVTTSKTAGNSWLVFPKPNAVATIRLFCFPFAGGGAATYRSWGEALHPSIEVVAIDPPGRASRIHEPPINTFKAFLHALIPVMVPYLDKPCAFFGHCLGGLTLFETARNLFKHHQLPLKQIFVSGSRPPHRILQDGPFEESLMGKLLKHDKFDPFLLTHEQPDEVFADVIRHFNIGATEEFLRAPELRHLLLPAIRAEFDMAFHYRFMPEPPWDVPITCFTGLDDTYVTREDAMAWHRFTKVAFRVHMREGAHFMVVEDKDFILETINRELCS